MSKLCLKCQYFVGTPLLSNTALILLGMEFTRAAQGTLPLHHLHLQQQGSCLLGGVFGVVMLQNSFWREGIIFCFRMSQYMLESMIPSMNRSSPVPAVVRQPQNMMLPPTCLTVGKAQFSWYSSPGRRHMLDTSAGLRLIRPQDMVPAIHVIPGCLQQTVCRLFLWASFRRGFLLGWWPCKLTCCCVWRMVWALTSWPSTSATSKAMLAALMRLFFETSFCTWRTAQGLNIFDRPLWGLFRVKPVLENLCMTLATVL